MGGKPGCKGTGRKHLSFRKLAASAACEGVHILPASASFLPRIARIRTNRWYAMRFPVSKPTDPRRKRKRLFSFSHAILTEASSLPRHYRSRHFHSRVFFLHSFIVLHCLTRSDAFPVPRRKKLLQYCCGKQFQTKKGRNQGAKLTRTAHTRQTYLWTTTCWKCREEKVASYFQPARPL